MCEKPMNVRWDAVVGRRFPHAEESPRPAPGSPPGEAGDGQGVAVRVWLYGTLANVDAARPIELQLPARFSADTVIGELGRRLGPQFLAHLVDAAGRKYEHCRVFVDGVEVEHSRLPVHDGTTAATVEMILLTAIEGG